MNPHLGDRLAAYLDGELPRGTRELVAAHLAMCSSCRAAVAAEARTKASLGQLGRPPLPTALLGSLLELATPGEPLPPRRHPLGRSGSAAVPVRPCGRSGAPSRPPAPRAGPARARRSLAAAGAFGLAAVALASANTSGAGVSPAPANAVDQIGEPRNRGAVTVGPDVTHLVGIEAGPAAGPATFSGVFYGHVHR